MEFTIETGIAMPKSVRKSSAKEAKWAKLFTEIRPTVDAMQPNESFAFTDNAPTKTRRDLIWALNKYGLHTGKRFGILATEPIAAVPAVPEIPAVMKGKTVITEAVPAVPEIPAVPGNVRVFCLEVGLTPEAYDAGQYAEKFTELFAEVVVPETEK